MKKYSGGSSKMPNSGGSKSGRGSKSGTCAGGSVSKASANAQSTKMTRPNHYPKGLA